MYRLEELDVYQLAEGVANRIWQLVIEWDGFSKYGLGKQLTSATDSISANIAEGYGRFSIKENINFCYYARGSLHEAKSWITKASARNLISEPDRQALITDLELIHKKLNGYIKILKQNLQKNTQPPTKHTTEQTDRTVS